MNGSDSLTPVEAQVDKGIQGSAFAARETHKNVGIAKVHTSYMRTVIVDVRVAGNVLCAHGNGADARGFGVVVVMMVAAMQAYLSHISQALECVDTLVVPIVLQRDGSF